MEKWPQRWQALSWGLAGYSSRSLALWVPEPEGRESSSSLLTARMGLLARCSATLLQLLNLSVLWFFLQRSVLPTSPSLSKGRRAGCERGRSWAPLVFQFLLPLLQKQAPGPSYQQIPHCSDSIETTARLI